MQSSRRSREKDERTLLHFDTHRLVLVSTKLIITMKCYIFLVCFELCASHPLSLFCCTIAEKGRESPSMGRGPALFRTKPSPLPLPEECARARGGGGELPTRVFVFWVAVVLGFRGMDVRTASPGVRIGAPHYHAERWDHLGGQDDLGHDENKTGQDDSFPLTTQISIEFSTDFSDFLDFSKREIFSWPPNPHSCRGGEGFFSSEKMALASRCSSSLGTSRGPAERASARAVAPSGRDGRPSRGSRPSSRLRTLASGNRNKRCANAGLIVDEVQDVTSTTGAGEDDRGLAQGPDEGAQAREPEYDFDFEAEKTKLLNERKQLEEILERIEEHERSLASGEAVAGKPSASSASSPALLRRDRYRASLLRQRDGSGEKGAGGVVEEKAKKAKKKGSGRPKKQGVLGQGDFVSKSSEESLSVASTSSSSDAVTTLLQERRHLELLSREEEARLIESAQFCFLVEEAMAREGTFVKNAAKGSSSSRSGGGGGSANSGEVQKGYYEVVAKAINAGLSDGEAPLSVQQIKRRHLHAMEARRYMLDHNVRLVVHLAHRYRGKGVSLGDLVQEGHQGLLTALQKFDLERGLKFSTYATWWIRQSLIRALQNHGRDPYRRIF